MTDPLVHLSVAWLRPLIHHRGGSLRVLVATARTGAHATAPTPRPLNLGLIIDRSGSMSGEPLSAVRRAVREVIERLGPADRLSLVTFHDEAEVLLDAQAMDVPGRTLAHKSVLGIEANAGTNLSAGWLQGARCVAGAMGDGAGTQSRLILLSDGHANRGIRDAGSLRTHAEQLRLRGLFTSAVGIGDDYDPALLQSLAEHGGGRLHDAERPQEIVEVVLGELAECRSIVAEDLALTLTFPSTLDPVLLGIFPQRPVALCPPGDRSAEITLGAMTAGSVRHAVIRLDGLPGGVIGSGLHLEASLSWRVAGAAARAFSPPAPLDLSFATGRHSREQPRDDALALVAARAWQAFIIQTVLAARGERSVGASRRLLQGELPGLRRFCQDLPGSQPLLEELELLGRQLAEDWSPRRGIDLTMHSSQILRSEVDLRSHLHDPWSGEREES